MTNIAEKYNDLCKQRSDINKQIEELREQCSHSSVKKTHHRHDEYGGPTSYSTNFTCTICGKFWIEEGSK